MFSLGILFLLMRGGPVGAQTTFVIVKGTDFYYGAQKLAPYGATFYPYWNHAGKIYHGDAWTRPDFPAYIDFIIAMAGKAGLNTLRATDFLDGATRDWRNPTVWANMDYFVHKTVAAHLFVILSIDAYRKWLIHNRIAPYEASRWNDYIAFFARRYGSATNILYIPIAGELPPPSGKNPWKATAQQYIDFYTRILTLLHRADPNHLHTVGGLSFLNRPAYGIPWQTLFSLPYNDLAAVHVYSEGDRSVTLPMVGKWCADKKMPFVLEEFGAKQSMDDQARADYFTSIYRAARQQNAAGIAFWNLGPENAPSSYEVGPQTPRTFSAVQQNAPASASSASILRPISPRHPQ